MSYQNLLYTKNGISTKKLAKIFLAIPEGSKIPTITELNSIVGQARGTVQNAIKLLQTNRAIKLEARGALGTYLIKKDMKKLLAFSDVNSIVGVMPLPYSRRYEGFATGIIAALNNQYELPVFLAYMRGAKNRINMLLSNRYDFAVISKYAALEMQKESKITIVKSFGTYSYLSKHIVVFHDKNTKEICDGMKVGVDNDSIDQIKLSERICKDKKVTFVPTEYTQILQKVMQGEIDVAIWNEDEIMDKLYDINFVPIDIENALNTEAVIVVDRQKKELISLLNEIIDVDTVLFCQQSVLEGKMTPNY